MSDYNDDDFRTRGPGYYRVYYMDPERLDGPFDSIPQLAETTELYSYPRDGYIVHFDGEVIGTVPSLNPDDLLQVPLPEGAEDSYRSFFAVPAFEEVDRSLVAEWAEETLTTEHPGHTFEGCFVCEESFVDPCCGNCGSQTVEPISIDDRFVNEDGHVRGMSLAKCTACGHRTEYEWPWVDCSAG